LTSPSLKNPARNSPLLGWLTEPDSPDELEGTNGTTGLLIIRAWVEPGSSEPLRAQLRLTNDVSAGIERTLTLSRADKVCAAVGEWLADIMSCREP
jgi:hypothetical protein